jgi:VanZ family protein
MRKRCVYFGLVVCWCVMIFSITSSPAATSKNTSSIIKSVINISTENVQKIDYGIRKAAHVTLFGILAVLVLMANWERKNPQLTAWIFATLYGASDEVHQIFESGRTPLVSDVFIDSIGAVIAILVFYLVRKTVTKFKLRRIKNQTQS